MLAPLLDRADQQIVAQAVAMRSHAGCTACFSRSGEFGIDRNG
jgi:hypothetical protein